MKQSITDLAELVGLVELTRDTALFRGSNAFGLETYNGKRSHAIEIYFELIRTMGVDVTAILTHRFRLDRYAEALLACRHQGKSRAVKVLFEYKEPDVA